MKQIRVKRQPGIEALTQRTLRSRVVQSAISYYQINQKKPKVDTPLVILHAGIAKNILSDVEGFANFEDFGCAQTFAQFAARQVEIFIFGPIKTCFRQMSPYTFFDIFQANSYLLLRRYQSTENYFSLLIG